MRILLWSSTFWPHIGGVEVLGANLAGELCRRGHEVTVVTRRDTEDLPATSTVVCPIGTRKRRDVNQPPESTTV